MWVTALALLQHILKKEWKWPLMIRCPFGSLIVKVSLVSLTFKRRGTQGRANQVDGKRGLTPDWSLVRRVRVRVCVRGRDAGPMSVLPRRNVPRASGNR